MAIEIIGKTTALVLIDLQKGILGQKLEPHAASQVVDKAVAMGKKLESAGGVIVLVHVGFSADGADRLRQAVDMPFVPPADGMPANFAEFVEPIAALPAKVIVKKRQWGGFYGTELDLQLRRRKIETIILAGVSTSIGVEMTAREAWQHGYNVVIAEDACSSNDAEMHRFSVEKVFGRIGRVRGSSEIVEGIS